MELIQDRVTGESDSVIMTVKELAKILEQDCAYVAEASLLVDTYYEERNARLKEEADEED